jgi:asparagine synthase (glutamine-hydrolysing)
MFGSYAVAAGRGGHRHRLDERAAALGLPVRVDLPDLLLVATEGMTILSADGSVLIGQAFNPAGERLACFPEQLSRALSSSDRSAALRGTWGNYALFSASSGGVLVYREPSGSVPVYRCGDAGLFVSDAAIASHLELLRDARIDRAFLVHWLQFPFLRTARSGLRQVTELLPGMALTLGRTGEWIETAIWHPSSFAARDAALDDPAEAARRLRETALATVAAQPGDADIILRLSGGLDSSIIAACLADAGTPFRCVNFATRARDGDERSYARSVAAEFGLDLVEVGEPGQIGLEVPRRRSFRPLINPLLEPFERAVAGAAEALGTSLMVDGAGGDNLFCSITSAAPVLDALAAGPLGQAAGTVRDIAARADCTIWEVLGAAARRALRKRPPWKEDCSFLLPQAMLRTCELHPWLSGLAALPGKREHVEALVHIHHFLDRSPSPRASLHPLLAQPLVELCLRIPSWLWVRGGRDRAVAREAFAGLVPSSILRRRTKGSLQSLLYRSFEQLRAGIGELILEGELARRGIVDAAAVDRTLAGDDWKGDAAQLRISEMAALELWLRSWRADPADPSTLPGAKPTAGTGPPWLDRGREHPRASNESSRGCAHRRQADASAGASDGLRRERRRARPESPAPTAASRAPGPGALHFPAAEAALERGCSQH